MGYDKLVNSAQLDADLTAVADAIREKGGTSAALAFPDGFVDAIEAISAGGSGFQSGTFVLASNGKTFTVPLDGAVTHFLLYIEDYPVYPASTEAGWLSTGGFWLNDSDFTETWARHHGGNYNTMRGSGSLFSVSADELTGNVINYNLMAGKTYYWVGW